MKKMTLLLLALPAIGFSQQAPATHTMGSNVQQISATKWDPQSGLVYKSVQGANLGATSFELMDKNRIAYLSDASNEIIIADQASGNVLERFPVTFAPRDLVFDKGNFYVLAENNVIVYDQKGNIVNTLPYPGSYVGVERLARYNNSTYLLLPSGNSVKIESNGFTVEPVGYKGWITSAGNFVTTRLSGRNSYSVEIITPDGKNFSKTLSADRKVGAVYVIGATANRVYLDVQTYITESPVNVERHIVSVELNSNGLGNEISSIKVPDCYYVLSNKDMYVSADGSVSNMVTSPEGTFVFSLTEAPIARAQNYPTSLLAAKYHFNDHLLKVDEK